MTRPLTPEEVDSFRAILCEAAAALFVERGAEGVTLRALAERTGVSRTTPYRYFRNKDEILAAVQATAFEKFADAVEAAAASTLAPMERLRAIAETYVRFALDDPDTYRTLFGFVQRGDYPELRYQGERARRVLLYATTSARDAGLIEGDPNGMAHVLWASLHGVISLHLVGQLYRGPDVEALAALALDVVLRGIRSEG